MNDYLEFRTMISSGLIKVVYVVGFAFISLAGIVGLFSAPVPALVLLVVGNGLWRLFCEGVVLVFSIHELLVSIDKGCSK